MGTSVDIVSRVRQWQRLLLSSGLLILCILLSVAAASAMDIALAPPRVVGLGSSPTAIVSADFNQDGKPDLAVLSASSTNVTILFGTGDGSLQNGSSFPAGSWPLALAAGDFNYDGRPDLVVVNQGSNELTIFTNVGNGGLPDSPFLSDIIPKSVAAGDFNGDGLADLALLDNNGSTLVIYLNNFSGSFYQSANYSVSARAVSVTDFNGDNLSDLLVVSQADQSVSVMTGQGYGQFQQGGAIATAVTPLSAVFAELNGDGIRDLAVVGSDGTVSVLPGAGNGAYLAPVSLSAGQSPQAIAAADFSFDNRIDLVAANQGGNTLSLYLNTSSPSWTSTYPKTGAIGENSVELLVKAAADCSVFVVCVPSPSSPPTPQQVRSGRDANGSPVPFGLSAMATISSSLEAALSCTGLAAGTVYDIYAVAEASSFYLQADPAKISAVTKLSVPFAVTATAIAPDGFTALWNMVPGATGYRLDVATDAAFTSFVSSFDNRDLGGVTSFAVSGLASATTYYYRVRAYNAVSTSASSNQISVTTATPPPAVPAATAATSITRNGFTANWEAASAAAGYLIDVATDSGFTTFVAGLNNLDVGIATSFPVGGLTAGGTYYYRVRAYNQSGTSTPSAAIMVRTLPAAPIAGPAAFPTTSGFTANWKTVAGADGYRLDVAQDAAFTLLVPGYDNHETGTAASFPVSGLTPGASYFYRVRAWNTSGTGGNSSSITVTIPAVPPVAYNAPRTYLLGAGAYQSAIADYNGDGAPDTAVANRDANSVSVLIGNGDGTFRAAVNFTAAGGPISIVAGDLNGDGRPDLVTANYSGNSISFFLGNGDGTFQAAANHPVGTNPQWVVMKDLNGDGKMDLAVANSGSNSISILLGNGNGTFAAPVGYQVGASPVSLVVTDLTGDGKPDLAVVNFFSSSYSILIGNGDGTFKAAVHHSTLLYPFVITSGDLNGDGKADLAFIANAGSVLVFPGVGDGTFLSPTVMTPGGSLQYLTLADLNNDNRLDLLVSADSGNLLDLYYGNGDATFQAAAVYDAPKLTTSVTVADVNGDGRPDIALTSFGTQTMTVLLQTAGGLFAGLPPSYSTGSYPMSLTVGDFNNDGKADVAGSLASAVALLNGNGDGSLAAPANITLANRPSGSTTGYFNNDGILDLAVSSDASGSISVLIGNGNGTFQAPVSYGALGAQYNLAAGDFNGDGKLDLVVADYYFHNFSVLIGNGDGTFKTAANYPAGNTPFDIEGGDFDKDGKLDLVMTNTDDNRVSIFIGNGNGTFKTPVSYAVATAPRHVVPGDFNEDGVLDLAVTSPGSNSVSVLLGNGNGTFKAAVNHGAGTAPSLLIRTDVNGDTHEDLVVLNGNYITILSGKGDGTFSVPIHYWTGSVSAIASGSFNGDGRTDLVIDRFNRNGIMILLNGTIPSFAPSYPRISVTGATTAQLLLKSTQGGMAFAVCLPTGSPAPTPARIKAGQDAAGAAVPAGQWGTVALTANVEASIPLASLVPGVVYDIYVLMENGSHDLQPTPDRVGFSTTVQLFVTTAGTGSGSVNSSPSGIACASGSSSGCSATFAGGSVILYPSPDSNSTFSGWSGACTNAIGNCTLTMNSAKTANAGFVLAPLARLLETLAPYSQLQNACNAAATGNTVQGRALTFTENIIFNRALSIFIKGGYDSSYGSAGGVTTIDGSLKIRSGAVRVNKVKIK